PRYKPRAASTECWRCRRRVHGVGYEVRTSRAWWPGTSPPRSMSPARTRRKKRMTNQTSQEIQEDLREKVRTRYAVAAVGGGGCCDGDCGTGADMTGGLYGADELGEVPDAAALASL